MRKIVGHRDVVQQVLGFLWFHRPRKSKDQTLPLGSRESFTWIILKTILCLVLDSQGRVLFLMHVLDLLAETKATNGYQMILVQIYQIYILLFV